MPHYPKPFYRKPRRRWYVEIDGKQINLGPDRGEAFRTYHELMASPEPVNYRATDPGQPVALLCDRFLEWVQTHRAEPTYEGYRYRLQRFIDLHPELTVDELRPFHAQEWADAYDISQTTKRNYLRSLKTCLTWCCKQGYIEKNPLEHMDLPAANRKDIYVPPELFHEILGHINDPSLRELFITTYECGCRPQESLRVERRHVDLEHQRWVFPSSEAKGKSAPRIVYLTDKAMEITRRLIVQNPTGNLFRSARGNPWTADTVNSAVDRIRMSMGRAEMERLGETISDDDINRVAQTLSPVARKKGKRVKRSEWQRRGHAKRKLLAQRSKELVPRYSLYALRHSWATNALKSGVDSLTVAILMGHQDPSMLAKVYQHLSHNPQHMLDEARRAAM